MFTYNNTWRQQFFVGPGRPTINTTKVDLVAISITWFEPKPHVGPIINYKVCWFSSSNDRRECKNVTGLVGTVEPLTPGTAYTILVSAFTKIGEGNSTSVKKTTKRSGK